MPPRALIGVGLGRRAWALFWPFALALVRETPIGPSRLQCEPGRVPAHAVGYWPTARYRTPGPARLDPRATGPLCALATAAKGRVQTLITRNLTNPALYRKRRECAGEHCTELLRPSQGQREGLRLRSVPIHWGPLDAVRVTRAWRTGPGSAHPLPRRPPHRQKLRGGSASAGVIRSGNCRRNHHHAGQVLLLINSLAASLDKSEPARHIGTASGQMDANGLPRSDNVAGWCSSFQQGAET